MSAPGEGAARSRYRRLLESLPWGFFAVDGNGTITDLNEATVELLAAPREELVGSAFDSWVAEDDLPRAHPFLGGSVAPADEVEVELRLVRSDGEGRRVRVAARVLRDAAGRFEGSEGVLRDVTAERRTAEALRRSDERLGLLMENLPGFVWTVDRDLRVTWGSATGAGDDLVGMDLAEAVGGDATGPLEAHREALEGRSAGYRMEWRGSLLDVRVEPLVEDGRVTGVVGLAIDVTDRVEAERELQRQRAYRREFFRAAPEGIVVLDREARVLSANPEFHRMFGYPPVELAGRSIVDLIVPRDRLGESRDLKRRALGGERLDVEAVRQRRDGSRLRVSILTSSFEVDGEPRIIAIYRDVTERKRLEEQLLQSQRLEAVGQLAGGIAHDFNNIMAAILGHARVLRGEVGEGSLRDDLAEIEASAERAASLVRQLLAFSRRQRSSRSAVSLTEVVSEMRDLLDGLVGARAALEVELASSLRPVSVDPGQMEQVIVNLAMNARDALPAGGTVRIVTGRASGALDGREAVFLEVSDDGRGMSEEERTRMFEPFFTTKGPGDGRGLGLSMVYGIVEQAGGRIHVRTAEGEGTSVRVVLPVAAGRPGSVSGDAGTREGAVAREDGAPARDDAATRDRAAARDQAVTGSGRIVLADDDRPVREVTRRILERQGFDVVTAASGAEALEKVKALGEAPGLLLTDVVMPGMPGPELAEAVNDVWPGTPVLFMSGYTESELSVEGAGESPHFIAKPFDPSTLARRVREALGSRRDR